MKLGAILIIVLAVLAFQNTSILSIFLSPLQKLKDNIQYSDLDEDERILRDQSPILTLKDFIQHRKNEEEQDYSIETGPDGKISRQANANVIIENLLIDGMDHYAGVACINSASFSDAKHALARQLLSIPDKVREEIVDSAIIEGSSVFNVIQNSSKPLQTNGKANAYLGWWKTKYTAPSTYETCVLVSGIEFTAAEIIAGYIQKKKTVRVGYQPCKCGILSCHQCPIFKEELTEIPIYKRNAFSLGEHDKLHHFMISKATNLAERTLNSKMSTKNQIDDTNHAHLSDHFLSENDGWKKETTDKEIFNTN